MISLREKEIAVLRGLQEYLNVVVIRANVTTPKPAYPYVSYTITTPIVTNSSSFGVYPNNEQYKHFNQIWSVTVQSDDDTQALELVMKAHDYFERAGIIVLGEQGISVEQVGSVDTRDNLISIEYEYRKGFDVTLRLMQHITKDEVVGGYIETATIKYVE